MRGPIMKNEVVNIKILAVVLTAVPVMLLEMTGSAQAFTITGKVMSIDRDQ